MAWKTRSPGDSAALHSVELAPSHTKACPIKSLPLKLDVAGVARKGFPLTQGIPFAEGELKATDQVRLVNSAGTTYVPTQATPLAYWRQDRKHVKWLLIDALVDADASPDQTLTLEYGPDAWPYQTESPIEIENERNTVRLFTSDGELDLTLARRPAMFKSLTAGSFSLDGKQPTLVMRDQDGIEYSSAWSPLEPMIEIESAGPIRACVKISGLHADERGRPFCPFELRLHAFAGSRDIRLQHTYIFDQDPSRVRIGSIELRWPLVHKAESTTVGVDGGKAHGCSGGGLHWMQHDHDRFDVRESGTAIASGRRSNGWVAVGTEYPSTVLVVIRDAWQQYPKGFRVDDDQLAIELWPGAADTLNYDNPYKLSPLRFPGRSALDEAVFKQALDEAPGAPLNLKSIGCATMDEVEHVMDMVARFAPDRPNAFCDTDIGTAWGTAKTHECWLRLGEPIDHGPRAEAYAAAVQQPILAWPDPTYVSDTGAARVMHAVDRERFPGTEEHLELIFDKLALEPQEKCPIYGMLDYGELINGHNTADPLVYRSYLRNPDKWPGILDRLGVFNNESQDVINQLWTYYLRTGDRKYFTFADAKTRHTVDVDWTHTHPSHGHVTCNPNTPSRCVGLMHYHSALNWSGPWLPSHSLISGVMRHYYLTGDRRSLDVALATADNHVRNATSNGLVRGSGINREVTGQVQNLLEAYAVTWDARYETIIRASLAMLHAIRNDTGNLPADINTGHGPHGEHVVARGLANRASYPGGMLCYVLADAWELFRDDWMRDWIEQLAVARVHGMRCDEYTPHTQLADDQTDAKFGVHEVADGWYWHSYCDYSNYHFDVLVAVAWKLTGREDFLAYLHHRLEAFPAPARDAWRCLSGHTFNVINHLGDAIPAMMACVADADDETLARAGKAWREQRAADGWPVYDGPRVGYHDNGDGPGKRTAIRLKPEPGAGRGGEWVTVFPPGEST